MHRILTIDKIFELASQIEKNSIIFYKTAANKVTDPIAKTLLLDLAQMEAEHMDTFDRMKNELSDHDIKEMKVRLSKDGMNYLIAHTDLHACFHRDIDTSSLITILKHAIASEKEAIIYYTGIRIIITNPKARDQIDGIIKEEMSHVTLLAKQLVGIKNLV